MPRESVHIEYNRSLAPLEAVLADVRRPGDFFVSGVMEIPLPKVEVEGIGPLSFPVPEAQILQVIGQATRAPYGRGEQTILDESVRKVWQVSSGRVRVGGKSWPVTFDGILRQVAAGLGCEADAVSAELYKLLVYDPGGFFAAHRDTEKVGGMFGTLVVVLPAAHQGGKLVLRHAGREATLDLSPAEVSEIRFAAFYADCEHEVRPITGGHRVCLVYNLIQRSAGGTLRAPDYEDQIATMAGLLERSLTGTGTPAKIAWLMEHHYSPEGLSFAGLKAADAARVSVLIQSADRAHCVAHLAIVHIEESGEAEPVDYWRRSRDWGRYHDDGEDEGAREADSRKFEVVEVFDRRHYMAQWRDQRDEPVEFGEIPLVPGELLPAGALDAEKPDQQRLLEASGNEGCSFERSYHRAVLVIWRRDRYAEVLLQAGVAAMLPLLKERVEACSAIEAPPSVHQEAVDLARQMVDAWRKAPPHDWRRPAPSGHVEMLKLLTQLQAADLLARFVAEVVTRDYDGSENPTLTDCVTQLGANETGRLLGALVSKHFQERPGHCVDLLVAVAARTPAHSAWKSAVLKIAGAVVAGLDDIAKPPRGSPWADWETGERKRAVDSAAVANLLNILGKLKAFDLRSAAVLAFAARPEVFDAVTLLVPVLDSIAVWDAPVMRLWEHAVTFLLRRNGRPPKTPRDWRQEVKLSCACADCSELQAFTLDPVERTHRFRMNKNRRQHLHQQIERHGLDMTHVTERLGSPQTLVCQKDRRSHHRRCQQYRHDIAALRRLADMGRQHEASATVLEEIQAAIVGADTWSEDSTGHIQDSGLQVTFRFLTCLIQGVANGRHIVDRVCAGQTAKDQRDRSMDNAEGTGPSE